mmetsp:Transcript_95506/g.169591  ORF Transcript_95506/g.169591 Transcript_95506/m.169591 type:complete len:104 (+) Transcript_95506:25-336(+)
MGGGATHPRAPVSIITFKGSKAGKLAGASYKLARFTSAPPQKAVPSFGILKTAQNFRAPLPFGAFWDYKGLYSLCPRIENWKIAVPFEQCGQEPPASCSSQST